MAGEVLCPYCGKRVEISDSVVKEGSQYRKRKSCCHLLFEPFDVDGDMGLFLALLDKFTSGYEKEVAECARSLPEPKKRRLESLARQDPRLREVRLRGVGSYFFIGSKDALHDLLRKLEREIEAAHKAGRARSALN